MTKKLPTREEELDWRESAKANELREFIDKSFRVRKPTLGGLERELIIDFVAKELENKP